MFSARRRRLPRRSERGSAIVEAALLIPLMVPLMLGMIEYGHYFWITVNAVEAAKWGVAKAASTNAASPATGCLTDPNPAKVPAIAQAGHDAAVLYLTTNSSTLVSYSTVTVSCVSVANSTVIADPSWQAVVKVDYPPVVGFRLPWMRASTTPGYITYSTPAIVRTY